MMDWNATFTLVTRQNLSADGQGTEKIFTTYWDADFLSQCGHAVESGTFSSNLHKMNPAASLNSDGFTIVWQIL